jgi:hypothetical protein
MRFAVQTASGFSYQASAIRLQLSGFSYQASAIRLQLSAFVLADG